MEVVGGSWAGCSTHPRNEYTFEVALPGAPNAFHSDYALWLLAHLRGGNMALVLDPM